MIPLARIHLIRFCHNPVYEKLQMPSCTSFCIQQGMRNMAEALRKREAPLSLFAIYGLAFVSRRVRSIMNYSAVG